MRGAQSDLYQVLGCRINIHAGVGQEIQVAFPRDHGVAAGNLVQPFAHANNLQRRADCIGKMLSHARHQSIRITQVQHHGTEYIAVVNQGAGFIYRNAAPLSQSQQFLNVTIAVRRC